MKSENPDIAAQRILETILQVLVVPLCIAVTWARMTPAGLGDRSQWQKINFLDAGYVVTGNYMLTILLVIFAALTILLAWTKLCHLAVIPAGIEMLIILITYGYFTHLRNADKAFVDLFGIVHSGLVLAGFLVTILMMKAHVDSKKEKADTPDLPEDREKEIL